MTVVECVVSVCSVNYEQNEFDSTAKVKVYARAVEEAALERDQVCVIVNLIGSLYEYRD